MATLRRLRLLLELLDVLFDVTHVVILKRSVLLLTLDAESSYMKGLKPAKNV